MPGTTINSQGEPRRGWRLRVEARVGKLNAEGEVDRLEFLMEETLEYAIMAIYTETMTIITWYILIDDEIEADMKMNIIITHDDVILQANMHDEEDITNQDIGDHVRRNTTM
ncbi:hypothetical protein DdX_00524 [Ditylenchus destructor]|uniref:Uncharacterized protein n=1 Tax=Ditylenchus destructor TaxID=166010 RepID=A0AAD4NDW6_9BILA|nr:hypothetical protein DdX_00524 [Ditylenchus destructor]